MKHGNHTFCDLCLKEHDMTVLATTIIKYKYRKKSSDNTLLFWKFNELIQVELAVCEDCKPIVKDGLDDDAIDFEEEFLGPEKVILI